MTATAAASVRSAALAVHRAVPVPDSRRGSDRVRGTAPARARVKAVRANARRETVLAGRAVADSADRAAVPVRAPVVLAAGAASGDGSQRG